MEQNFFKIKAIFFLLMSNKFHILKTAHAKEEREEDLQKIEDLTHKECQCKIKKYFYKLFNNKTFVFYSFLSEIFK